MMIDDANPPSWARANFLWIGSELSPVEVLALKSYINTGWTVTLYTYGDVAGVPEGCAVRDGRAILDDALIFADQENGSPGVSFSNFADLFRWRMLSKNSGWWFDMDMVSIAPPSPIHDNAPVRFGSTWEQEWGVCATNCVMYSNGTLNLFEQGFQRSMAIIERGEERNWLDLGPFMLQKLVKENSFERFVAPWWEFCPFPWRQIKTACSQTASEHAANQARVVKHTFQAALGGDIRPARLRAGTRAVHMHNEIWRRAGLAKTGPFSRYSFLARQLRKHDVTGATIV